MPNIKRWADLPAVSEHFSESVKRESTSSTSMSAILEYVVEKMSV